MSFVHIFSRAASIHTVRIKMLSEGKPGMAEGSAAVRKKKDPGWDFPFLFSATTSTSYSVSQRSSVSSTCSLPVGSRISGFQSDVCFCGRMTKTDQSAVGWRGIHAREGTLVTVGPVDVTGWGFRSIRFDGGFAPPEGGKEVVTAAAAAHVKSNVNKNKIKRVK